MNKCRKICIYKSFYLCLNVYVHTDASVFPVSQSYEIWLEVVLSDASPWQILEFWLINLIFWKFWCFMDLVIFFSFRCAMFEKSKMNFRFAGNVGDFKHTSCKESFPKVFSKTTKYMRLNKPSFCLCVMVVEKLCCLNALNALK